MYTRWSRRFLGSMPYFNGVQMLEERVVLLKTPSSKWLGANLLMVREANWLLWLLHKTKHSASLELAVSYNLVEQNKDGAIVKFEYTPKELSDTYLGLCARLADDALKQMLEELVALRQTQKVVDHLVDL